MKSLKIASVTPAALQLFQNLEESRGSELVGAAVCDEAEQMATQEVVH